MDRRLPPREGEWIDRSQAVEFRFGDRQFALFRIGSRQAQSQRRGACIQFHGLFPRDLGGVYSRGCANLCKSELGSGPLALH